MLVQAGALIVFIGQTVPSYLDYLLHPMICGPGPWCIDLRGLAFELSAVILGPPALFLVVTAWLWRQPRRWPAALPIVVDVAFISVVIYDAISVAQTGHDQYPSILAQAVLGLVPASVTLALTLLVLKRNPGAPIPPSPQTSLSDSGGG
jgi:hypothetical protein